MRRIVACIIIMTLCISLCSCAKDKKLIALQERYPDSQITKTKGGYKVVSENADRGGFVDQTQEPDPELIETTVYDSLKEFEASLCLNRNAVFVGKKTGESRQVLYLSGSGVRIDFPETYSKVEVITPLYGDVDAGDEIVFSERFAVCIDKDGTPKRIGAKPLTKDEYIYIVADSYDKETPYGSGYRYSCFYPDRAIKTNGEAVSAVGMQILAKYVEIGDTALDRAVEARKMVEWKRELASRQTYKAKNRRIVNKCDKVLADENADVETLLTALDKDEAAMFERCIKRYGEK